jgi:hypothetical protein
MITLTYTCRRYGAVSTAVEGEGQIRQVILRLCISSLSPLAGEM